MCVRRFTPESNEHVETDDDAPPDALLVVSKDAPKLEADRKAAWSKAEAGMQAAKAREAALESEFADVTAKAAEATTKTARATASARTAEAELAAAVAAELDTKELLVVASAKAVEADLEASVAGAAESDKVRIQREIGQAKAEQERFAAEMDRQSRPHTTTVTFMFRRREGELSDEARLESAMLVPGEGAPIPLQFEGGNAGRSVTMTAELGLGTTVYVALHLVGLAGVAVEVMLIGGGTIMSVPA